MLLRIAAQRQWTKGFIFIEKGTLRSGIEAGMGTYGDGGCGSEGGEGLAKVGVGTAGPSTALRSGRDDKSGAASSWTGTGGGWGCPCCLVNQAEAWICVAGGAGGFFSEETA